MIRFYPNIEEVKAGGRIIAVTDEGNKEVCSRSDYCISVPETNSFCRQFYMAIPLQLLAYHIGVLRGCDVGQPRNLAKKV